MTTSEIAKELGLVSGSALSPDFKLDNGRTVEQECQWLAKVAMGLLAKNINAAYKQGELVWYHRTMGAVKSALDYSMDTRMDGNILIVSCKLSPGAMHPALYGKAKGRMVNTLRLMDEGYSWRKPHIPIPYFTDRPAGNIIQKTIDEFYKSVQTTLDNVKLSITFD